MFVNFIMVIFVANLKNTKMNNELENELNIQKVNVLEVIANDDEVTLSTKGYFLNELNASIFAKDCGWFGRAGKIYPCKDTYTNGTDYFKVQKINIKDADDEKTRATVMEGIKKKLTAEEIEFLGLGQAQM